MAPSRKVIALSIGILLVLLASIGIVLLFVYDGGDCCGDNDNGTEPDTTVTPQVSSTTSSDGPTLTKIITDQQSSADLPMEIDNTTLVSPTIETGSTTTTTTTTISSYDFSECGGILPLDQGAIVSHDVSQSDLYPPNLDCKWFIAVQEGYRVLTEVWNCYIHGSGDYLEFLDGNTLDSPVLLTLTDCNFAEQDPFDEWQTLTSSNLLVIRFVTDNANADRGFYLEFKKISEEELQATSTTTEWPEHLNCNDTEMEEEGVITSPNFPNGYPPNQNCTWSIIAPQSYVITIDFNHFELEVSPYAGSDYANYTDVLLIFDGLEEAIKNRMRTIYGAFADRPPWPSTTTRSQMLLRFMSNGQNNNFAGFSANITFGVPDSDCYVDFNDDSGEVMSFNYPGIYRNNEECYYQISIDEGHQVLLHFLFFELETNFDVLNIIDGDRINGNQIRTMTGYNKTRPDIVSSGHVLTLHFRTDYVGQMGGWHAVYSTVQGMTPSADIVGTTSTSTTTTTLPWSCGGDLVGSESGTIASPGFPDFYPDNANCEWRITVPAGKIVVIQFTAFDIEFEYDWVYVYDGLVKDWDYLIGNPMTGSDIPGPIPAESNNMTLILITDEAIFTSGFHANYTAYDEWTTTEKVRIDYEGCGGNFTEHHSGFQSPLFPENYPNDLDCVWYVSAPPGFIIKITFHEFWLEEDYDYLRVHNGPDLMADYWRLTGLMAGWDWGDTLISTTNKVVFRFMSDYSTSEKGFSLTYAFENPLTTTAVPINLPCVGNLTLDAGILMSPNHPNNYPSDKNCQYIVTVQPGHRIMLVFEHFQLEEDFDFLFIYNSAVLDRNTLIATLTGYNLPDPIEVDNNVMTVHFQSDSAGEDTGYKLSFTKIL